MNKCLICHKETKYQYSLPNDDVKFSHCKAHEILVETYAIQLRTDDNFDADKWLKKIRNESKGTKGTPTKKGK